MAKNITGSCSTAASNAAVAATVLKGQKLLGGWFLSTDDVITRSCPAVQELCPFQPTLRPARERCLAHWRSGAAEWMEACLENIDIVFPTSRLLHQNTVVHLHACPVQPVLWSDESFYTR